MFIGLNQTPAQLGTYNSLDSCQNAIRTIYETKYTPRGVELSPQVKETIKSAVDNQLRFQRDYICTKKD